jgi:hypothetical protein
MADEEPLSKQRKWELSESQTTVPEVWRVDHKAADILHDVRWRLSANHLEDAKKILKTHKIKTVSQLKDKIVGDDSEVDEECRVALGSLFPGFVEWGKFTSHLTNSIQESLCPEDILHTKKRLNAMGSVLAKDVSKEDEFTEEAISVNKPDTTQRQYDIRIVQGPVAAEKLFLPSIIWPL